MHGSFDVQNEGEREVLTLMALQGAGHYYLQRLPDSWKQRSFLALLRGYFCKNIINLPKMLNIAEILYIFRSIIQLGGVFFVFL